MHLAHMRIGRRGEQDRGRTGQETDFSGCQHGLAVRPVGARARILS